MDPYRVLNVDRTATDEDIRAAYRALLLKYHPDKTGTNQHLQAFYEVQAAYQILKDPEQRRRYDALNTQKRSNIVHDIIDIIAKAYKRRKAMDDLFHAPHHKQRATTSTYTTSALPEDSAQPEEKHDPALDVRTVVAVPLIDVYKNNAKEVFITRQTGDDKEETCRYVIPLCQKEVVIRRGGHAQGDLYGDAIVVIKILKQNNIEKQGADLVIRDAVTLNELFTGVRRDYGIHTLELAAPLKEHRFDGDRMVIDLPGQGLPTSIQGTERGNLRIVLSLRKSASFYKTLELL